MDFKNGVKNIQAMGYNGVRTEIPNVASDKNILRDNERILYMEEKSDITSRFHYIQRFIQTRFSKPDSIIKFSLLNRVEYDFSEFLHRMSFDFFSPFLKFCPSR